MVAWYPFDGNASDMSGNGNHGTVNGATLSTDRHEQSNKAYSFDGVDDQIIVANHSSLKFRLKQVILAIIFSGLNTEIYRFR